VLGWREGYWGVVGVVGLRGRVLWGTGSTGVGVAGLGVVALGRGVLGRMGVLVWAGGVWGDWEWKLVILMLDWREGCLGVLGWEEDAGGCWDC